MANPVLIAQGAERRVDMVRYIREYCATHGFAPTITEIADGVGLSSPNGTRLHLLRLQDDGFLTVRSRIGRSIVLTSPAPDGWTR